LCRQSEHHTRSKSFHAIRIHAFATAKLLPHAGCAFGSQGIVYATGKPPPHGCLRTDQAASQLLQCRPHHTTGDNAAPRSLDGFGRSTSARQAAPHKVTARHTLDAQSGSTAAMSKPPTNAPTPNTLHGRDRANEPMQQQRSHSPTRDKTAPDPLHCNRCDTQGGGAALKHQLPNQYSGCRACSDAAPGRLQDACRTTQTYKAAAVTDQVRGSD
jgi:hypothetical protein